MSKSHLLLGVLLVSIAVAGCNLRASDPKAVPDETTSLLFYSGSFFGLRRFTFTGVAFMDDRLFAGSDRGVYEVIDGKIEKRFNWMPEWDVVETLFYDRVNNCLWLDHTGIGKLIRFDGKNWSFVSLPTEDRTRGEALAGFQMFNSNERLYAYSPKGVWRWDERAGWSNEPIGGLNCAGERPGERKECFLMAGAIGNDLVAVFRHDASLMSVLLPDTPNSTQFDEVCLLNKGICTTVLNPQGKSFFVKTLVSGSSQAYILTYSNELFALTVNGLEQLPSPGSIEKIIQTDSHSLLVTLANGSVFEFSGEWKQRTVKPFLPESPEKIAYIAEHRGMIAYAISTHDMTVSGDCSIRGQSAFWIIQDDRSLCVR